MNLLSIMNRIESVEFSSKMGVASTLNVFLAMFDTTSEFQDLILALRKDVNDVSSKILSRIRLLVNLQFDPGYENPYDTALAAYAMALAREKPAVAPIAGELIINARQSWWSRYIALSILAPEQQSAAETVMQTESVAQVAVAEAELRSRRDAIDVGQVWLVSQLVLHLQKEIVVLMLNIEQKAGSQQTLKSFDWPVPRNMPLWQNQRSSSGIRFSTVMAEAS